MTAKLLKHQGEELIKTIMEAWQLERDPKGLLPPVAVNPSHPYANIYDAAISLIDYVENPIQAFAIIKAVIEESIREAETLDWIASEIWFEIRASGRRGRSATALEDLKYYERLNDGALDYYNRRMKRLNKLNNDG